MNSDSEPDDDTITIAMRKVVISSVRVGGIGGASRTKQNDKQNQPRNVSDLRKNKESITKAMHDNVNNKISTIAMFGD